MIAEITGHDLAVARAKGILAGPFIVIAVFFMALAVPFALRVGRRRGQSDCSDP